MVTILLVEDDVLLADCYMRWLKADGCRVIHATTAQDAIDMLDEAIPQALMLDILLPGANGIQVLHALRSHADLANIPVIVCSNALPEDPEALLAYGVNAMLDKSTLTRSRLQNALRRAVS